MKQTLPYSLDPPPAYASFAAHAVTFTKYCFETTPRALESLPIPTPVIAGKRQPMPIHVFGALLAKMEDDHQRMVCLAGCPARFAADVKELLPQALEARAEQETQQRRTKAA